MMAQKLTAKQRCLILSFHFAALTESVGLNLIGDGQGKIAMTSVQTCCVAFSNGSANLVW
jgi:hypothetical protein